MSFTSFKHTFVAGIFIASIRAVAIAQVLYVPSGTVGTSSNSYVGIGTTSPQQKLEVNGAIRSQSLQLFGSGQLQTQWWNTGDPVDQRFTELIQQGGQFAGRFVNDAYNAASYWLAVKRNSGTYTVNSVCFPNGLVGIGTSNPNSLLEVDGRLTLLESNRYWSLGAGRADGSTNGFPDIAAVSNDGSFAIRDVWMQRDRIRIDATGNVGIGTSTPIDRLQVTNAGDVRVVLLPSAGANNRESLVDFWATFDNYPTDVGPRRAGRIQVGFDGGVWGTEYIAFGLGGATDAAFAPTERMRIIGNGNVGIGTTNPTQKLSVNGTVRAKEVIVDTGWSDYVFDESYKLSALSETEAFVRAEKHLPGIPSAKEVAENGISVGDMQAKLLAKIEELTLHVIAQEKLLAEQTKQLSAQSARIERLETRNAELSTSR